MEKIIIVHYIGVESMNQHEITKGLESYRKNLSLIENDKEYKHYLVTDPVSNSIKIDCINPKLVSASEYEKIMDKLEYISKQLEK